MTGYRARLLLHPDSEPGFSGTPEPGVSGPPPEASTAELPSFAPDPVSNQPHVAPQGSSTAAPGGGGSAGARPAAPGDPNQSAIQGHVQGQPGSPAQQQAAAEWQSIRDAAARFGYNGLANFQDDEAALVHLVQQAQRAQQSDAYAQLGRAIAPDLQQYQEFRNGQPKPGATPAPDYAPPPFDPKWMALVTRDEASGMYYSRPGVSPSFAEAVNKRMEWQDKFQQDPIAVMDQYAQSKIPTLVQQQVSQALAQHQRDQAVNQILQANDPWLYQRDASGRPVMGPNGKVPTPEGAQYIQQIRSLQQAGVTDPVQQDALARQLVAGQMALGRVQAAQGATPPAQTQQAGYRPNVNPNQARGPLERQQTPGTVEPNGEGLSLTEMMRAAFDQAGYTEQRFQQEIGY